MPRRTTKYTGLYGKRGRPPKDWKPPPKPILIIKTGKFVISFS
jgi:hypothetical protein